MARKKILFIVLLGGIFFSHAQVYVSPSTHVFVNNEVLFVKQDVANNGVMFLRRDGQLLQGVAGVTANKGAGTVSVYQEGTCGNYDYNYWCSPVGTIVTGQEGIAGNFNADATKIFYRPNTIINSDLATILPWGSYDGQSNPLSISSRWLWKFVNATAYSQWVHVGNGQPIAPGEGFTMKGTAGTDNTNVDGIINNPGNHQRIDFRGRPNDGDIVIPCMVGQQTLTGNPYPSAIDLSYFLLDNPACDGTAQFWEQDKTVNSHTLANYRGGYGTFSPAATLAQVTAGTAGTGIYTPAIFYSYDAGGNQGTVTSSPGNSYKRRFSPVAQGFLITGANAGVVTMRNQYRVFVREGATNNSQFERNASSAALASVNADNAPSYNPVVEDLAFPTVLSVSGIDYTNESVRPQPQVRINTLIDNQGVRQSVIGFHPEATDGVDRGMDAISSDDGLPSDMFFVIDDKEYVINMVAFDENKRLPLGFKNGAPANYRITVQEIINADTVQNVYLHDKVNNQYYDIKNGVHELNLPAGTNKTDYEITFKRDSNLGLGETIKNSLLVYQDNSGHALQISNPMALDLKTVVLYDVVGKVIFEKTKLGNNTTYSFPTANLSDGIYIVRMLTSDNQEISRKIIIKN
ncbi:T9SS type A sorting domain-containing protein [Flavobacterium sp. CAU 1735]|uniref:T9SS type A sorting domain-containing protein n=1 Tax=Flavobacterium sp. CAU 1735 TaxID=3140361 RepID=UPI00326172CC